MKCSIYGCKNQTKNSVCDKCYEKGLKEKTSFIKHLNLDKLKKI